MDAIATEQPVEKGEPGIPRDAELPTEKSGERRTVRLGSGGLACKWPPLPAPTSPCLLQHYVGAGSGAGTPPKAAHDPLGGHRG